MNDKIYNCMLELNLNEAKLKIAFVSTNIAKKEGA